MRRWLEGLAALGALLIVMALLIVGVILAPCLGPLWFIGRLAWRAATDRLLAGRRARRWRALCQEAAQDEARWALLCEETLAEARVVSAGLERDAPAARGELLGLLQVVGVVVAGAALLAFASGLAMSGTIGAALDAGFTVGAVIALVCLIMWGALAVVIACDRRVARLNAAILMERVALSHDVTGGLSLIDEATADRLRGALSNDAGQGGGLGAVD